MPKKNTNRRAIIRVRVTHEQKRGFRRAARQAAATLSCWLRDLGDRAAKRRERGGAATAGADNRRSREAAPTNVPDSS